MNVIRSDDVCMANEVAFMFPEMHCNDMLDVHGIHQNLQLLKNLDEEGAEPSDKSFDKII